MKKRIVLALMALLVFVMAVPVSASVQYEGRVLDEAELLSNAEEEELAKKIDNLIQKYNMDIVILIVEDYTEYMDDTDYTYSDTAHREFAKKFYWENDYGFDSEKSGMILMLSMAERDWYMYIEGEANVAVNDYGSEYITDRMLEKLKDDKFAEGFSGYLDDIELFLKAYDKGKPYGDDHPVVTPARMLKYFGIAIGASVVLALVIVLGMKSGMNTAKPKPAAKEYVKKGSFVLTSQQDLYLYSNTTKTAIPKSSSSSGGGSGRSSGSRGGGGRGGKF